MVKALVKRLENPDPTVAGPAAHLLAQIAVTDDVRLAIAKEGPVDVPVLMLGTPQLVLPASELLAAIAGCDYLKQVCGIEGDCGVVDGGAGVDGVSVHAVVVCIVCVLCVLNLFQLCLI